MELEFAGNERIGLEVVLKGKRWESEAQTELMTEFFDAATLTDAERAKCLIPSPFGSDQVMIDVAATRKLELKAVEVDSNLAKFLLEELDDWKKRSKGLSIDDYRWFAPLRNKLQQIQPGKKKQDVADNG